MTTEEIKKMPEWPTIVASINQAVKDFQKQYPHSKVELVQKKEKFLIVVDREAVMEITGEDLKKPQ